MTGLETTSTYFLRPRSFKRSTEEDLPPPSAVKRKKKSDSLHSVGYRVFKSAVEIEKPILDKVQSSCKKRIRCIFNHNETNARNDHKRRQRSLPLRTKYMRRFDEKVKDFVAQNVNTDLKPTNPVILHSRPGCQPQAAHCDYVPDEELRAVSDETMPLAMIVCLMPETRLKIWPHSARLATSEPALLTRVKPIPCQEVELDRGDILVFRGDFVHAGSGYKADNYRIHYYLDSPDVSRANNRTWLIHKHGDEALRRIIKP